MNFPRSTEPRPLFKHIVIGSCRTYSNYVTDKPKAAITYNVDVYMQGDKNYECNYEMANLFELNF